ncbi:MAG: flagellar basal body P-ring formation protein FlgA [Rickettsia sp.]|nr:flagellar basal body P-ring formation protein FlgA [Rickettsia sp.]
MKKFIMLFLFLTNGDLLALHDIESSIKNFILQELSYNISGLEIFYTKYKNEDYYKDNIDYIELVEFLESSRSAKFNLYLGNAVMKSLTVYYDGYLDVLVSTKYMKIGQTISAEDFKIVNVKISKIGSDFIKLDPQEIVNMRVKKNINKNKIIKISDLTYPYLINQNDIVDVIYQTNSLGLKITGIALSGGLLGDVIKVKNIHSSSVLYAKIFNHKTAIVN